LVFEFTGFFSSLRTSFTPMAKPKRQQNNVSFIS
jgi:hypothetical protein